MSTEYQEESIQLDTTLPHSGTTESGNILHPPGDGDQEKNNSKNPSEVSLVRNGHPAESPDIGIVSQPLALIYTLLLIVI